MAKLLVSVRSGAEARAAVLGGAALIDVKEPNEGALGRAAPATWREVRAAVPAGVPVSVALGELVDLDPRSFGVADLAGIAFQKAGPARSGRRWADRWRQVRAGFPAATGWVAVAYTDWVRSGAPHPDSIVDAAIEVAGCAGVLFDTWDKGRPAPPVGDDWWDERIRRIQASGRFVALAGRLDRAAIRRLRPLKPDLFAVRGAACSGGDRREGRVDARRVADLVALLAEDP